MAIRGIYNEAGEPLGIEHVYDDDAPDVDDFYDREDEVEEDIETRVADEQRADEEAMADRSTHERARDHLAQWEDGIEDTVTVKVQVTDVHALFDYWMREVNDDGMIDVEDFDPIDYAMECYWTGLGPLGAFNAEPVG